ncbi:MAG: hypothetical protein DRP35_10735 [Candidatus Zixiibacteriota bacterium]|nr:MAG: hypothetical protein DRP35_10735 [candidate division Zixibacteria bacterium]
MSLWNEDFTSFDEQNIELLRIFSLYSQSLLKNALLIKSIKRAQKMMERKSLRLIDIETTAALADMTTGVAHEFNNIIGGVVGRLQLLKIKSTDEKMEVELDKIEKMLMESAYTIKRIQEFTAGTKSKNLKPENLKEIINDLIEDSSKNFNFIARKRNVALEVTIEEDNPIVCGNFVDIGLAIEKVIENAVEYSDENTTVEIILSGDEKYIRVKIVDAGSGIPRENRKKIFYPFFTSKTSKTSGLSLSIVHGIIANLNGKIKIYDNEPKGTIFEIALYRDQANQDITDTSSPGSSKEFLNILIVDDDKEIREVLFDLLSIYGHNVTTCYDAYEALKTLEKSEFDLMITDLGMPGMSGMELAGIVNKDYSDTSIAMITGWGTQLNKDEVKKVGIRRVLSKPFRMNDIRELIEEVV